MVCSGIYDFSFYVIKIVATDLNIPLLIKPGGRAEPGYIPYDGVKKVVIGGIGASA